jgi:DNA replication and repair protein RecF
MKLKKLNLLNFRNYTSEFEFSPDVNLIIGPNTAGKTNLMEAIHLLATGESFKAQTNNELIQWGEQLAMVEGWTDEKYLKLAIKNDDGQVNKEFWVDEVDRKKSKFRKHLAVVLFRPQDIRLVSGSPGRRRNFLDDLLSSLDWQYYQALLTYNKAVSRRNQVLKQIQANQANKKELFFWSQTLEKNGEKLNNQRQEFIQFCNYYWQTEKTEFKHLELDYQASPVTVDLLKEKLDKDIDRGVTTIGPHRDDFIILSSEFGDKQKDLAIWGSRGQQRLAVLGLKLAHLAYVESEYEKKPLLLLDDIFSELDEQNRELVVSILPDYQAFITSTDSIDVPFPAKVFNL